MTYTSKCWFVHWVIFNFSQPLLCHLQADTNECILDNDNEYSSILSSDILC